MEWRNPEKVFSMSEPRRIGLNTEFGFWLMADHDQLLDAVAGLICIVSVLEPDDGRSLVEISDDHDPDEAWHWVRTELEHEVRRVVLDPLWEEALKWL